MLTFDQQPAETQLLGDRLQGVGVVAGLLRHAGSPPDQMGFLVVGPNGSTGVIEGNVFVQGRDKENYSAFIAVAAEGKEHSSNGLIVRNNDARVGPGIDRTTTFLADWSGDRVQLGANRLGPKLKPFERR